jgi:phosphoribosylformimino-5-aminoimidazole carboxamide ribotide isomerase
LDQVCIAVFQLGFDNINAVMAANIKMLENYCSEFLVHAADVEGKQAGMAEDLIEDLAEWCNIPVTYAGGAKGIDDLDLVNKISKGKVDLTIGSALDIFGGSLVKFEECVGWNQRVAS